MIPLPLQILIAVGLDALCGDPRWLPHPVQAIAKFALAIEEPLRKTIRNPKYAGVVAWIAVVSGTAGSCAALLWVTTTIHPLLGDLSRSSFSIPPLRHAISVTMHKPWSNHYANPIYHKHANR